MLTGRQTEIWRQLFTVVDSHRLREAENSFLSQFQMQNNVCISPFNIINGDVQCFGKEMCIFCNNFSSAIDSKVKNNYFKKMVS